MEREKCLPVQRLMTPRHKEQSLSAVDMRSAESGELDCHKESGGSGVEDQCLGPQFVLTTVHTGCYFWTRPCLIPGDIASLGMLRRDERAQGFQEIWVNPVFILFPAGCFEHFNLTERQKSFNCQISVMA